MPGKPNLKDIPQASGSSTAVEAIGDLRITAQEIDALRSELSQKIEQFEAQTRLLAERIRVGEEAFDFNARPTVKRDLSKLQITRDVNGKKRAWRGEVRQAIRNILAQEKGGLSAKAVAEKLVKVSPTSSLSSVQQSLYSMKSADEVHHDVVAKTYSITSFGKKRFAEVEAGGR